jgi:hypothetical protein
VRYTQLRGEIIHLTAPPALSEACREGWIVQADSQYRQPGSHPAVSGGE